MKKIAHLALLNAATAVAFANTETAKRIDPVFTGVGVKLAVMPVKATKRGSATLYPFDKIAVGEAFGVNNKTAANLSSIVSNANRKNTKPVLDGNGNPTFGTKELSGEGGIKTLVPDTSKPKREAVKHFYALDVTTEIKATIKGTALEGSTALVFRDK